MLGAGGHTVWIDPERDAVTVLRWMDNAAAPKVMRGISEGLRAAR
jgi:hypothetical protein